MQVRGYRATDAATKFQLINDMWKLVRELARAGIRGRKLEASAADIERELAVLFLGPDLAAQVRAYPAPRQGPHDDSTNREGST